MILIVEDDLDIRETLKSFIEIEGYAVTTAKDGREAVDLLKQGLRPELILLDLMMPVMNGWQFVDVLRSQPEYHAVPIVVTTAMASKEGTVKTVAAFMPKPLDFDQVLQIISRHCSKDALQAPAA